MALYRRRGTRGPAGRLLYDPARIDPRDWLAERLGEVTVLDAGLPLAEPVVEVDDEVPEEPEVEDHPIEPAVEREVDVVDEVELVAAAPPERRCEWFVFHADDRSLRHCGQEVAPGRTWCASHIQWSALITGLPRPVSTFLPPFAGDVPNDADAGLRPHPPPVERFRAEAS
jgi:hypothetical protein